MDPEPAARAVRLLHATKNEIAMNHSPLDRASRSLSALGWLLVLHALADVLAGVYRCLDLDPGLIDVFTAALARSQVALLAIWFAVGREPWSWRLCGLIAGHCFLFSVMSGLALPGQWDALAGAPWFVEEWTHYYRPSGPGDVLVKAPIVVPAVALPLLAWRGVRGRKRPAASGNAEADLVSPASTRRLMLRFGFQDMAVWSITLSLVLVAVYQTAPYKGWADQLLGHWQAIYRMDETRNLYSVASSGLYVWVAYLALWATLGRWRAAWRLPVSLILSLAAGIGFELWLHRVALLSRDWDLAPLWFQASAETAIATLTWLLIAASLGLFRLYEQTRPTNRPQPPGRHSELPAAAQRPNRYSAR